MRRCSVCLHRNRVDIDAALDTGEPYRQLALLHGLSRSALCRHWCDHGFLLARIDSALEDIHSGRVPAYDSLAALMVDLAHAFEFEPKGGWADGQ